MSVKNFGRALIMAGIWEYEKGRILVDPCPPDFGFSPLGFVMNVCAITGELNKEERIEKICSACQAKESKEGRSCPHLGEIEKCVMLQKLA
ncbi:hypothetical protein IJT93_01230 [bacterium]|nr:hypothetical protein [bacterium]